MKAVEDNAALNGKLPLHYAAENGAPFNVLKLLLEANREAVTTADKARSSAHAKPRTRCGRSSVCPLSPSSSHNL